MKSEFAWLLAIGFMIGTTGCKKPVYPTASTTPDSETVSEDSQTADSVSTLDEEPVPSAPAPAPELAATEPPRKAPDPRTQARVQELEYQISKLSENLQGARKTIDEAQEFHGELVKIFAAEEKKAAALKAARVYERMRNSSCSG